MPHKMLHVVSLHNHCFEFMVVVNYCGYFSKRNSYFSTVNITYHTKEVAVNHQDAVP